MRAALAMAVALVMGHPVAAQPGLPNGPVLDVELDKTETIPGQPVGLRLTVLVPTFLPSPPVWPSFEAPNLLIRLPERSTGPTSKRVGDATWSGVTRNYRIAPMVPGKVTLPAQEVLVTYADPETSQPVTAKLRTDPVTLNAVVPEGAEGLDPFIAARSLELKQSIEGQPGAMKPGDSVTRTVTATVAGVSPMFLPGLLRAVSVTGVAAYPDEPAVAETDARGVVGGSRTERVTLVAEHGGGGELPPVAIDWFNLSTGQVETARVDGVAIAVDGPPARSAEPRDWRAIALAALAGLLALALLAWLLRRALPPLTRWLRARRAQRLASEAHAYALLRRAVARRDHAGLRPALDVWAGRLAGADPRLHPLVQAALTALGAARYGGGTAGDAAGAWRALAAALPAARRGAATARARAALPPLNPCSIPAPIGGTMLTRMFALALATLTAALPAAAQDSLPSWNEGPAKAAILDFVADVTTPGTADFVPVAERIAVFDNDGTLWIEQPMYVQGVFAFDRVKDLAPQHPEWKSQQPFKAALEGDKATLADAGEKGIVTLIMATHAGMTVEQFAADVTDWLATAQHPRFQRPYTRLIYQPMVELLEYLRANGFKTFIVSGGGVDFMRPWTESTYGIPPEQVVGSSIKSGFAMQDGKPVLTKLPEIEFIDDKEGKPSGIHRFIGRRPIAAFGNSDGDLQMLQWTTIGAPGRRFGLIVHHDDAQREYAYDRDSHVGRLDKALDAAPAAGWTVVSMKNDWREVFPSP